MELVKHRLHRQLAREPTISEWAKAVGMSSHSLRLCIAYGNLSRDKMFYANLRLVVHIAKRYQGQGLNFKDLLQFGSMGLMKSFERFNQNAGSRFGTYAFWWIRKSIREALFQYSRDIRLPVHVHDLLKKIEKEKWACIREGHNPTKRDLAERVGIKVEKLERLLLVSRTPISIKKLVWADRKVLLSNLVLPLLSVGLLQNWILFEEMYMIEDSKTEAPDVSFEKEMMRQHVRSLLEILPVNERRIIRLRYGIPAGGRKTLGEIGNLCGLSAERVRQIENNALDKLRGCIDSHGLAAYIGLIV